MAGWCGAARCWAKYRIEGTPDPAAITAGQALPAMSFATMNQIFADFGLLGLKPYLSALALPPLPWLLLMLLGAGLLARRRRRLGWAAFGLGFAGLWATTTTALGVTLVLGLNQPPPPLDQAKVKALAQAPHAVVLVLGAGRRAWASEYRAPDLSPLTAERLRYGVWLARQTRLPLAYSGGVGFGNQPGVTEAEAVALVAKRDFGLALTWAEDRSRDTAENAHYSVAMLHQAGIRTIVLVSHDFHLRRARRDFERALAQQGVAMQVLPAALGQPGQAGSSLGDYLPSPEGYALCHHALHEWFGWIAGA